MSMKFAIHTITFVCAHKKEKVLKIDETNKYFIAKQSFLLIPCPVWIFFYIFATNKKNRIMAKKQSLNRIKVVLAEKEKTNNWLAETLGKDPATVSKWCTNTTQPSLENIVEIAKCLGVTVNDLIRFQQE